MADQQEQLLEALGNKIKLNEPLKLHTTVKTGGPAKWYYQAISEIEFINAVRTAKSLRISYFVLGGGSNVLFKDEGFDGLVIKNSTQDIKIQGFRGKISKGELNIKAIIVEAATGVTLNQLVRYCLEEGLEGLEYFLGQPGSVGGAVFMNAHFPKKHILIGDYIISAKIITNSGEICEVGQKYFRFGYDESIIQKTNDIVLSVKFGLKKGNKDELWQKANDALMYRKETQPTLPSMGCTFRNIAKSDALRIATPNFTQSAGFLIDKAALKGLKVGGAQVSEKHANFIVNVGEATSKDILEVIKIVKSRVSDKFGVELKEEILVI